MRKIYLTGMVLTLLSACSPYPDMTIGHMSALTGRYSFLGSEVTHGVNLALKNHNSKRKTGEPEWKLITRDYGQDQGLTGIVEEFIEKDVSVILGPVTSDTALDTLEILGQSSLPVIGPTPSTSQLSRKKDNFFRLISNSSQEGHNLARFIIDVLKSSRLSIVYDINNESYTKNLVSSVSDNFEKTTERSQKIYPLDNGVQDSHLNAARVLATEQTDAILIIAAGYDAALLCQQIRLNDKDVPIIISGWTKNSDFLKFSSSSSENIYFIDIITTEYEGEPYKQFHNRFIEEYGYEPGYAGILGYESILYLEQAYSRAVKEKLTLLESLSTIIEFEGLQGKVYMDEYGDALREHIFGIIKEGKYTYLKENAK